jgi:hypothetical protein
MTYEEWQDEEAARRAADAVIHPKGAPSQAPPPAGIYEAPPSMAPPVLHRTSDFPDPEGGGEPGFDTDG